VAAVIVSGVRLTTVVLAVAVAMSMTVAVTVTEEVHADAGERDGEEEPVLGQKAHRESPFPSAVRGPDRLGTKAGVRAR